MDGSADVARAWLSLAEGSMMAGNAAMETDMRSAASRHYYAGFQAGHAIAVQAGLEPRPGFGTWSHRKLPAVVYHGLSARLGAHRATADALREKLESARTVRELADYAPSTPLEIESASRNHRAAADLVRMAKKVTT